MDVFVYSCLAESNVGCSFFFSLLQSKWKLSFLKESVGFRWWWFFVCLVFFVFGQDSLIPPQAAAKREAGTALRCLVRGQEAAGMGREVPAILEEKLVHRAGGWAGRLQGLCPWRCSNPWPVPARSQWGPAGSRVGRDPWAPAALVPSRVWPTSAVAGIN